MIGKCPNCEKLISVYTWEYMNRDMSEHSPEANIHKCKHCGVKVDWPIPERKAKMAKWLMPLAMLLAILVIIFTTSFTFYLLLFGTGAFASYLMFNSPVLHEENEHYKQ
jgi:hypothetical protein